MMDAIKEFAKDDFGRTVFTVSATLIVTCFGVFLGVIKDIFTDHWKRRRLIKYNAMLLATTLDQLIDDCLEVVFDPQHVDKDGVSHSTVPTPKVEWPTQLDWPSIPVEIMYGCLLMPGSIKSAAESADFIAEQIAGPPDYSEYFEELQDRFSQIGLAAVHLLNRLKEMYGVQLQERKHHDPQEVFTRTIDKIAVSREKQQAEQAAFMSRMQKSYLASERANAEAAGR